MVIELPTRRRAPRPEWVSLSTAAHSVLRGRVDLLTIPFLHRVRAVEALACLSPRPLCHDEQVAVLDAGRKAAERTTEVESAALLATLDRWLCNLCHTRDTQPVAILAPQRIVWHLSLHLESLKAHRALFLSVPTRLLSHIVSLSREEYRAQKLIFLPW